MLAKKRLASYFLVSALVLSSLSACAPSGEESSASEQATASTQEQTTQSAPAVDTSTTLKDVNWAEVGWKADPENLEWKQDTSPVKLSYYVNFSWFGLNWQDDTSKRVTEKTGVDLEFSKPVVDDNQKLNMMIAGDQLPDIMTLDRNDPAIQTMINAGMLYSFDELIEQYAPQMKDILPEEVLNNYKAEDGKTYQFTTWVQGKDWQAAAVKYDQMIGTNQACIAIRKDYYDEIGRPEIKNVADFTAALEKIKEKHPDKIGFFPADGCVTSDSFATSAAMGNLGIQMGLSDNKVVKDGKIQWVVRDQKFIDAIKVLNDMYKKGLLTKNPFIDTKDVAKAKIEKGDVVSYSWVIADGEIVPGDNPNTSYEVLPPFDTYEQIRTGAGWLATVVPKSCKNPERAIRFLEYLASAEGHQDVSWGIRGDSYSGDVVAGPHWNLVDGKPTMLPDYVVDKKADWGGVASKNGLGEYWTACNELLWNLPWWDASDEKMSKFNEMFGSKVKYMPELDIKDPDPTSEEGIIKGKAFGLLQQYSVKMVFADDADAEYSNFIKELDALGFDRVEKFWDDVYQQKTKSMQ